jgi:hypothetical protein
MTETSLVTENNKMAAEIEYLKATVASYEKKTMKLRNYWTLNKTSEFKLNQDKARINLQPQLFLRQQLKIALMS